MIRPNDDDSQLIRFRIPPGLLNRGNYCQGVVILQLLTLGMAWMAGGSFLLTRQLWMDEVHSWLLITDPDTGHCIRALTDGADFNPPTWFLITRLLSPACIGSSALGLRLLSLLWMLLALTGLYHLLSHRFDMMTCLTAVLLTASQPLLIHHSTEIRFYGFWCATVVWLCNCLLWLPESVWQRRLQRILTAGLTLSVATCHYFGILSLGLVTVPMLLQWKSDRRTARRGLYVAGIGCAGLLACLPILAEQRAALTRSTWISPTTIADSLLFLQTMIPAWQIALCLAGSIVSRAILQPVQIDLAKTAALPEGNSYTTDRRCRQSYWPSLSLLLMPMVVVAVSWCLQPALVTRYAIVGLAAFAPLFAIMLEMCNPVSRRLLLAAALTGFAYSISSCVTERHIDDRNRDLLIAELQELPVGELIVFEDRIVWMGVLHRCPELSRRCALADFTEPQLVRDSSLRIVQRDVARRITVSYPQYWTRSLDSLCRLDAFCVVPGGGGTECELIYPEAFQPVSVSRSVIRFTRLTATDAAFRRHSWLQDSESAETPVFHLTTENPVLGF